CRQGYRSLWRVGDRGTFAVRLQCEILCAVTVRIGDPDFADRNPVNVVQDKDLCFVVIRQALRLQVWQADLIPASSDLHPCLEFQKVAEAQCPFVVAEHEALLSGDSIEDRNRAPGFHLYTADALEYDTLSDLGVTVDQHEPIVGEGRAGELQSTLLAYEDCHEGSRVSVGFFRWVSGDDEVA